MTVVSEVATLEVVPQVDSAVVVVPQVDSVVVVSVPQEVIVMTSEVASNLEEEVVVQAHRVDLEAHMKEDSMLVPQEVVPEDSKEAHMEVVDSTALKDPLLEEVAAVAQEDSATSEVHPASQDHLPQEVSEPPAQELSVEPPQEDSKVFKDFKESKAFKDSKDLLATEVPHPLPPHPPHLLQAVLSVVLPQVTKLKDSVQVAAHPAETTASTIKLLLFSTILILKTNKDSPRTTVSTL